MFYLSGLMIYPLRTQKTLKIAGPVASFIEPALPLRVEPCEG